MNNRRDLAKRFADYLSEPRPGIKAVWLFGSLASGTDGPGSDVDIRVGIASEKDWEDNLNDYLACLPEFMVADSRPLFIRLVVSPGIVVDFGAEVVPEAGAYKTPTRPINVIWKASDNLEIVEASEKAYNFREHHFSEWPTAPELEKMIAETFVLMLAAPSVTKSPMASKLYSRLYFVDLAKLVYKLERVEWASGYKHIDEWMAKKSLDMLGRAGDFAPLFREMLVCLRMLAKQVGVAWPDKLERHVQETFCADLGEAAGI